MSPCFKATQNLHKKYIKRKEINVRIYLSLIQPHPICPVAVKLRGDVSMLGKEFWKEEGSGGVLGWWRVIIFQNRVLNGITSKRKNINLTIVLR